MKPNKTFFIKINHPKMRTETQKNTESQKREKKEILNKRSAIGGITITDLKIHYRVIIRTYGTGMKKTCRPWNKTEDPNMNIPKYSCLIVDKKMPKI